MEQLFKEEVLPSLALGRRRVAAVGARFLFFTVVAPGADADAALGLPTRCRD